MTVPVAPGFRDIGASTMKFIPVIYSGKILVKFYDRTVLAVMSNTDYEGEINNLGDEVIIRSTPDITIRDYKKGASLVYEQPESTPVSLLINKAKYWSFVTDVVDDKQTDLKQYTEDWTRDAAEQMKITIDTDILGDIYTDVHASNKGATAGVVSGGYNLGVDGGTSVALSKTNILDFFVDCGSVLDEQNIPESGRWFIIPPFAAGLIKKSDLKDASLAGDGTSIMRNGRIGMIDRFTFYLSNNLATTDDGSSNSTTHMLFGTKDSLTFAAQLTKNENLPNPNSFGHLFRGLQVFGYKVVKPEAIGDLYARKA